MGIAAVKREYENERREKTERLRNTTAAADGLRDASENLVSERLFQKDKPLGFIQSMRLQYPISQQVANTTLDIAGRQQDLAEEEIGLRQSLIDRFGQYQQGTNQLLSSLAGTQQQFAGEQADIGGQQVGFGNALWQTYTQNFQPVEQQLITDVREGAQPRYDEVKREAVADVRGAFANQRNQQDRQLSRLGVNPNSGRYRSASRQSQLAEAATTAGAVNQARQTERQRIEDTNFNRRLAVTGLGSQRAEQASTNLSRGGSAYGAASQGLSAAGTTKRSGAALYGLNDDLVRGLGTSLSQPLTGLGIANEAYTPLQNLALARKAHNKADKGPGIGGQIAGGVLNAGLTYAATKV